MRERKKSLERLLAVKSKLHRLEEARLADIEKQRRKAQDDQHAMLGFLEEAAWKDPLLLRLACHRVVAAGRGAAALDAEAHAQRQILLHGGAQKRGVEKLLKEAAAALDREEEKRRLLDIGEYLAGKPATSLP